jgi:hypothetical protein
MGESRGNEQGLLILEPSGKSESVLSRKTETLKRVCQVVVDGRARQHCSARCKLRGVGSNSTCDMAQHGADGPAKRLSKASRAWRGRDNRQFSRRGLPVATTGWPARQREAPDQELLANLGGDLGPTQAR